jgi:hypothetical protein
MDSNPCYFVQPKPEEDSTVEPAKPSSGTSNAGQSTPINAIYSVAACAHIYWLKALFDR